MLVQLVDRLGQGSRVSHECPTENKPDRDNLPLANFNVVNMMESA